MAITQEPWTSSASAPRKLSLVVVPPPVLGALASGDVELASRLSHVELTPYLLGSECRGLWKMRSDQIAKNAADLPWVTRIIVDSGTSHSVGLAGFHGRPDARGMVEIGYRIDPAQRRRGYARTALEILLATARDQPEVSVIRATVGPDNTASRTLIDQNGFQEVGEQWDEEDGLEIILEVTASQPR